MLVIDVVTPGKKEVHSAKGTPLLVLSPVKDNDVTTGMMLQLIPLYQPTMSPEALGELVCKNCYNVLNRSLYES